MQKSNIKMLPPKMNDSLLNIFLTNEWDSMSQNKIIHPREEKKRLGREPPALSSNVTLLIELGIVLIAILVVALIFYLSHRNSKKRSNRRRWMQSDINIDNSNNDQIDDATAEGRQPNESTAHRRRWLAIDIGNNRYDRQTYDPTVDERHPQTIELGQDDCPPSYESVVQHKNRKRSRKTNANRLDRNLPKCHHHANHDEALLSTQPSTYISTIICNENSSLIENQQLASTSSSDVPTCIDEDKVCTIRENRLNDDFTENNHKLQKVLLATTTVGTETDEKYTTTVPTKAMRCENGIAVLDASDASGLPTYDTALKIQECGNM